MNKPNTIFKVELNKNQQEHIKIIQNNISGGKTSIEEIENIKAYPNAKEITISGLKQDTFDYFLDNYGKQFKIINFWKCPLIADLKKLEQLEEIEYITYFWNQKATELWDLSKNRFLKGLKLNDFIKLNDLSPVALSNSIEELSFGNKIWIKCVIESLVPLEACKNLKKLSFFIKKIEDNDITPLSRLKNLEEIYFPLNLFTTEEIAWLKVHLPQKIKSEALAPYKKLDKSIADKDTFIIGKRKPFLNWDKDIEKIKKYELSFDKLIKKYSKNLTLNP